MANYWSVFHPWLRAHSQGFYHVETGMGLPHTVLWNKAENYLQTFVGLSIMFPST